MKSRRIFALIALTSAIVFSVLSCRKTPDNRRPGGEDTPTPGKTEYVDNPSWTLTYTGREVDVAEDGATYVVDPVYMTSNDKLNYFVDLISLDEYKSTYKSNVTSYIEGSFKNNFDKSYVDSGDSRTSFLALDAGDGSWVALAYEITSDNKLGTKYSILQFKTKAITMRKDASYELSYARRKKDTGIFVDAIKCKAHSDYSYYVDITYPEFLDANYGGDPVAWINARLDDIAATLNEGDNFNAYLSYGDDSIDFNRLRHGDWTAYAFGCDINGNLTGNWSKLDFDVAEETATADFNKWLGTWTIGGKSNDGKTCYYTIGVRSAENNMYYSIEDWENVKNFIFETEFDSSTGSMWFTSQLLGSDYHDDYKSDDNQDGGYDIAFIGNIDVDGDIYSLDYIDGQYDIAEVKISSDGKSANVVPEYVTVKIDKQNYTQQYCSMQYVDWTWDGYIATYNKTIPMLPMTMTKISGPDGSMASVSVKRPAAKKAEAASAKIQTKAAAVELPATRQAAGTSAIRSSAVRSSSAASKQARRSALEVSIPGAPKRAAKISGTR